MPESKLTHRGPVLAIISLLLFALLPGLTLAQATPAAQIHLQSGSFDPLKLETSLPAKESTSSALDGTGTYLLQFTGPVLEDWKTAVEAAGVRLYAYVPDYAFIAGMDTGTRDEVSELSFVRWVGPYRAAYRVAPALQNFSGEREDAGPVALVVQTLPDVDLDQMLSRVKSLGGNVQSSSKNDLAGYLRLDLAPGQVGELAALDGVLWVEPYFEPQLFNDIGGGTIMNAGTVRSSLGLYGSGQIVGVADSGLDVGADGVSADFAGRLVEGQAICAMFTGGRTTWNDFNGHGTHVSGSVLGNGALSGSNPSSHQYGSSYAGVAPEAQLVFQAIDHAAGGGLECVPNDLFTYIFEPAYALGARIHTNSWGGPTGGTSPNYEYGGYTSNSRNVDQTAWEREDLLILFAAGNSGVDANMDGFVDADSVGSPSTAKNAITVGASENNRPGITLTWGSIWPDDYPANPIFSDRISNNASGLAAFSSRGPTDDGRIKPDLVAPGTFIISSRSHDPDAGTGWGVVDEHYIYNGGTSMATPLTAGAAALVREWLTDLRGFLEPSAALMKAVLINGAADMSPGQYSSPREIPAQHPNNVTGWGRVDLQASLDPPAPQKIWLKDYAAGVTTGNSVQFELSAGSSGLASLSTSGRTSNNVAIADSTIVTISGTPEPPGADQGNTQVEAGRPVELKIDSLPVDGFPPHVTNSITAPEAAVSLVLDDGSREKSYGVVDDTYAYQFIWLNRFTPDPSNYPFNLDEIRVMFYEDPNGSFNVDVGDAVDLVVYQDADGNPANGATLLATYHTYIPAVDGTNWSVYDLSSPLEINGPGDVLIGVINRYVVDGVTLESFPATMDQTTSKNRSWIGWWNSTPPDPATLPPGAYFDVMMTEPDAGNWLIRGYGQTTAAPTPTATSPSPTPTATSPSPTPTTTPLPAGGPLRITLAWTDYPGSTVASKALVNNLDLEVIAPDGQHYYGNTGVYASGSSCLRDNQWDRCNNVEGVLIPKALDGTYTVIVHGYNVPNGPQPFALVASGDYLQEGSSQAGQNKIFLPVTLR